tara:strand:- start:23514 stop:24086 length:573 start_codon:yes stop_codon:yes gene_type:complete
MQLKAKTPIVLDLETLGLKSTAAVIEIGAINMRTGATFSASICPEWYARKDRPSLFHVSPAAIAFHQKNNPDYLARLNSEGGDGRRVVEKFLDWCKEQHIPGTELHIWCQGKDADIPWIGNLAAYSGLSLPWHYRNAHCTRDLFQQYPEVRTPHRGDHTALADAKATAANLDKLATEVPRVKDFVYGGPI